MTGIIGKARILLIQMRRSDPIQKERILKIPFSVS